MRDKVSTVQHKSVYRAVTMIRLVVCACALLVSARASVVVTSSGPVRGTLIQEDGFSYYAYQAIPYAESPTGDLRFEVFGFV